MKSFLPHHQWELAILMASLLFAGSLLNAQNSGGATNPPLVVVVAPDPTALEGTSSGAFTLIRYGPTNDALAVDVNLSGTASNGVDYVTISNVITIPAGALATDVLVDPIVDTLNRGNKSVIMVLKTNADYLLGEHRYAQVQIIDDVFDFPPPTVVLTSPTNNSVFDNPPSITLSASAGASGLTLKYVSFYANDDFLGRATHSPYSVVWSNPPSGQFTLFARAVDPFGRSALSAPVNISVSDIDPVVALTSPTNGANFIVHQNIPLTAEVSDADTNATIASVTFFANDHRLGTVTNSPYALVWSNAPAGFFALRAVASDASGDKGYSKPVFINVSSFGPKISLMAK